MGKKTPKTLNSHFDIYSGVLLHMTTDQNLSNHSKMTDFSEILDSNVGSQKGKGAQH